MYEPSSFLLKSNVMLSCFSRQITCSSELFQIIFVYLSSLVLNWFRLYVTESVWLCLYFVVSLSIRSLTGYYCQYCCPYKGIISTNRYGRLYVVLLHSHFHSLVSLFLKSLTAQHDLFSSGLCPHSVLFQSEFTYYLFLN